MSAGAVDDDTLAHHARRAFARRTGPGEALAAQADVIAATCRAMAERFAAGGRLLAFGTGAGATDAQHVSVEFVHPVIVGKRALPALSLASDAATVSGLATTRGTDAVFAHQVEVLGRPTDIALGLVGTGDVAVEAGLRVAREAGLLTVALRTSAEAYVAADHVLTADAADPHVGAEVEVTIYHLLWELTHAFLDDATQGRDGNADLAQLYPFLYDADRDPESVVADVAASARAKAREIVALRTSLADTLAPALARCAEDVAARLDRGGTVLACGNGGSSADAQQLVHALLAPGPGTPAWPALCLTNDIAVVSALANDVGFEVVFARQVRALGGPDDVLVGLSTSGNSPNLIDAFAAAKQVGMLTVGFAGGDGGAMADAGTIDHLFVVPSSSVHRVQEVQTTCSHVLCELLSARLAPGPPPRPPARG